MHISENSGLEFLFWGIQAYKSWSKGQKIIQLNVIWMNEDPRKYWHLRVNIRNIYKGYWEEWSMEYIYVNFKKSETPTISMNKYEYIKSINLKCLLNKICKTL